MLFVQKASVSHGKKRPLDKPDLLENVLGQFCVLLSRVSLPSPAQKSPPYCGVEFEHNLERP